MNLGTRTCATTHADGFVLVGANDAWTALGQLQGFAIQEVILNLPWALSRLALCALGGCSLMALRSLRKSEAARAHAVRHAKKDDDAAVRARTPLYTPRSAGAGVTSVV